MSRLMSQDLRRKLGSSKNGSSFFWSKSSRTFDRPKKSKLDPNFGFKPYRAEPTDIFFSKTQLVKYVTTRYRLPFAIKGSQLLANFISFFSGLAHHRLKNGSWHKLTHVAHQASRVGSSSSQRPKMGLGLSLESDQPKKFSSRTKSLGARADELNWHI